MFLILPMELLTVVAICVRILFTLNLCKAVSYLFLRNGLYKLQRILQERVSKTANYPNSNGARKNDYLCTIIRNWHPVLLE